MKMQTIRRFLEMIRFSHTLFALPFALLSAVLAWYSPINYQEYVVIKGFRWLELLGILLCMVFARSAAMAFNRLADRHYDAVNPRTAKRHLPAGLLPPDITDTTADRVARADAWPKVVAFIRRLETPE